MAHVRQSRPGLFGEGVQDALASASSDAQEVFLVSMLLQNPLRHTGRPRVQGVGFQAKGAGFIIILGCWVYHHVRV